jgi:hypothetical protein
MLSAVLPDGAPVTPPAWLLHDAVPLVYQLGSPFTKFSSAVTTDELVTGDDVGDGLGDGEGEGDELDTGGGFPPPELVGGVAPPPPPPPQAASDISTAGASSAAESRDGFMQS